MGALGEQEATSAWTLSEEQIDNMYQLLELTSFCVFLRPQREICVFSEALSYRYVHVMVMYLYYFTNNSRVIPGMLVHNS
jgi:hypothetical protein